jgi:hypothetical protein
VGAVDESLGQVQLSSTTQVLSQRPKDLFQSAVPDPALEPTMAGLVGRVASWQIHPRRSSTEDPQNSVQDVARVAVRPTPHALLDRLFLRENRGYEGPLLLGEVHIQVRSEFDPPVDPLPKNDRVSRT